MTIPLVILAAGAVVAGLVGVPAALGGGNAIERFLEPSFTASSAGHATTAGGAGATPHAPSPGATMPASTMSDGGPHAAATAHGPAAEGHGEAGHLSAAGELGLMALSVVVALVGIGAAWRIYVRRPELADRLQARFPAAHRVLTNKYYVDEAYHATAVRGTLLSSRLFWRFDLLVIDGLVNGSAWFTRFSAWLSGLLDRTVVDGLVNGTGSSLREASHGFRRLQTGLVQNYALVMMIGVFGLVSVYLLVR